MKCEYQRADEYCDNVTDGTHDSPKKTESGQYLITSKHIKGTEIDYANAYLISQEDFDKINLRSKVDQWDIIISMIGIYCGFCYIERNKKIDYAVKNVGLLKTGSKDKAEWLYYYINSPEGKAYLESVRAGSTQPYISLGELRKFPIPVPDESIRRKICNILGKIDKKIEVNSKINRNLQAQAQAYFNKLFVEEASTDWKEGTLCDIGTIVAGGTPSKAKPEYYTANGIAWITPKDLSIDKSVFISHGENDISELGYEKSSATKMPNGTVLFSSRAPIGYIAIADNEVTTNQGFKSVVPKEKVGTAYVYFLLQQLMPTIEGMASGSTFKEISGSAMKIVPIVIPDDGTLKQFNDFCEPIFKEIARLEKESKRLVGLRDVLLPKLMSGELDVSDLDI